MNQNIERLKNESFEQSEMYRQYTAENTIRDAIAQRDIQIYNEYLRVVNPVLYQQLQVLDQRMAEANDRANLDRF